MMALRWDNGAYEGDNRRLAWCGHVAVGAVFLPSGRARYTRFRVWCTSRMNPVEGTVIGEAGAREEVEKRFNEFLTLAGLEPIKVPA